MLQIVVPATEQWDELKQEFIYTQEQTLLLKHSLVSLSKWESKWCKVFLSKQEKTFEETLDYIRCMTISSNINSKIYSCLTNENISEINEYIEAPMTATYFWNYKNRKTNKEPITAELIYYWMITLNIPFECRNWHLNRLLTLIEVCSIKNTPPKKRSKREIMSRNTQLNNARKKQLNTRG